MAVDKKSQHVGNHGGVYTDLDGMSKQFTYIDHDRKLPSRTKMGRESKEELEEKEKKLQELKASIKETVRKNIEEILALPAVSFLMSRNMFAEDFIIRDVDKGIIWNETVVRDALSINHDMRYTIWNSVWKNTVSEKYWFEEMSHEDILAGKWKQWTGI